MVLMEKGEQTRSTPTMDEEIEKRYRIVDGYHRCEAMREPTEEHREKVSKGLEAESVGSPANTPLRVQMDIAHGRNATGEHVVSTAFSDRVIAIINTTRALEEETGKWPSNNDLLSVMSRTDTYYRSMQTTEAQPQVQTTWNHYCSVMRGPLPSYQYCKANPHECPEKDEIVDLLYKTNKAKITGGSHMYVACSGPEEYTAIRADYPGQVYYWCNSGHASESSGSGIVIIFTGSRLEGWRHRMEQLDVVRKDRHSYVALPGTGKAKTDVPCAIFFRLLAICEPDFNLADKAFLSYGSLEFAKAICFLSGECDFFSSEAYKLCKKADDFM
ncbi:hypothetical protein SpCBS45565_g08343 [Spizellomyces sp. 'palustris']|nr:hypothetical protein SpCBS45565_g08343 [Spizellomyces sp. 'palustris']